MFHPKFFYTCLTINVLKSFDSKMCCDPFRSGFRTMKFDFSTFVLCFYWHLLIFSSNSFTLLSLVVQFGSNCTN